MMQANINIEKLIDYLEKEYPNAECSLKYTCDYQLLFAVRLAAQCTDERVNKITPELFKAYPSLESFAIANPDELEKYIYSCGFFHSKSKDIIACAQKLINTYSGKVPNTMEDLLKLPGVGRKTANLILGDLFGAPSSIVVDTHCIRLSNRIGLTSNKKPEKIEEDLRKILPPEKSNDFCHRLVMHGRAVCTARSPKCEICCLKTICNNYSNKIHILI